MKLPKGFGGQGFGGALGQMKGAMARAQNLDSELAAEKIVIDKGPVKAVFNGKGELAKLTIDPAVVDPSDVEMLEDLISSVIRDGYDRATELRTDKMNEIMPNLPNIPGITS